MDRGGGSDGCTRAVSRIDCGCGGQQIEGSRLSGNGTEPCAVALKYLDTHKGCLPPSYIEDRQTGERHSWRVILLPHVTYDYIYGRYSFQEPWNGPHNRALLSYMPSCVCPTHSRSSELTNYVAVIGEHTFWPEPRTPRVYPFATVGEHDTHWPAPRGRHVPGKNVPPDSWTKIVLVELVQSDIQWTEPRDVTLDEFIDTLKTNPKGAFYNKDVKGIQAIDISGNISVIDPYDDLDKIRNMFLVADDGNEAGTEDAAATESTVRPAPDSDPSAEPAVHKEDER